MIRKVLTTWFSGPGESDSEKCGSNGGSCCQALSLLRSQGYFTREEDEALVDERTDEGTGAALKD